MLYFILSFGSLVAFALMCAINADVVHRRAEYDRLLTELENSGTVEKGKCRQQERGLTAWLLLPVVAILWSLS